MNKTHGLVASAWMLGGGLLLNVSLTAQAQDSSAASEEYFSPQRSTVAPTRKAPGLLPSIIRNADTSKAGSVVRPIGPATNSLKANRKINSAAPMATRPSNRSAVVPAALKQNSVAMQSANEQSDAAPSPIQKQLEELYRKDGRPMPQMNFSQTCPGERPSSGRRRQRSSQHDRSVECRAAQAAHVPRQDQSV